MTGQPTRRFLALKDEFDGLLADLARASEDHFGVDPDALHWGHIGDLAHRVEALRDVADAYYRRGEYATLGTAPTWTTAALDAAIDAEIARRRKETR
jgi:hypothetical protein